MRLIDGTDVKEPGLSGSLWRMHYSIGVGRIPGDVEKVRGGFLPPKLKSSEELEKQTKGNHLKWKMKPALLQGKHKSRKRR
jgi:hypothetical protein